MAFPLELNRNRSKMDISSVASPSASPSIFSVSDLTRAKAGTSPDAGGIAAALADFQLSAPLTNKRVLVAMSGGVDSSVVAALAARLGAEVIGITLRLYDSASAPQRAGSCCAGRDIRDARAVADRLGFVHHVYDYQSRFKDTVIEQFADDYLAGRTPIPCVRCNMGVKFTDLFALAKEFGADCLATGHYVRRKISAQGPELHRAIDAARDQSYFLFATTPTQLEFLRFPLGGLDKRVVRAIATDLGLGVAAKPDSQDICFVPDKNYAALVRKLRPEAETSGDIVHIDGRILGQHKGLIHYTVGQRRGIDIGGQQEPLYVVRLDPSQQRIFVGPQTALAVSGARLTACNWISATKPSMLLVKVRSQARPVAAQLAGELLTFDQPERGVAPGQAAVLYDATNPEHMLGGGWIVDTIPTKYPR